MNPEVLINKAQGSKRYLKILNLSLGRIIPFNRPHRIKVHEIGEDYIITRLPYRRSNLNHIKGLHACGMATIAEFVTGLSLLRKLDNKQYRLIMKELNVRYFYQGKADAYARFEASDYWVENEIIAKIDSEGKLDLPVSVEVRDKDDNHLATAEIIWQIKDWAKVKTKV